MNSNLGKRISLLAVPLIMILGVMGSSASATVQSARCSNRTLAGDYGFTIEGTVLAIPGIPLPPGVTIPVRGIVLQHYDGKGNLTQVDHVVDNGMPPAEEWTPGSGTYTVNPDCTGSEVINIPGNPLAPLSIHFVITKQGREIRQVVDANAVTAIGHKVD
jgi:hypothetical protein